MSPEHGQSPNDSERTGDGQRSVAASEDEPHGQSPQRDSRCQSSRWEHRVLRSGPGQDLDQRSRHYKI